jgi:hypothetical protein
MKVAADSLAAFMVPLALTTLNDPTYRRSSSGPTGFGEIEFTLSLNERPHWGDGMLLIGVMTAMSL